MYIIRQISDKSGFTCDRGTKCSLDYIVANRDLMLQLHSVAKLVLYCIVVCR